MARARFSSMVMWEAVPFSGSWNSRPMRRLRLCSGRKVMSVPPREMLPSST